MKHPEKISLFDMGYDGPLPRKHNERISMTDEEKLWTVRIPVQVTAADKDAAQRYALDDLRDPEMEWDTFEVEDDRPAQKSFYVHMEGTFRILMDRDGYYTAHVAMNPIDSGYIRVSGKFQTPSEALIDALAVES